jgi:hypothetical protein
VADTSHADENRLKVDIVEKTETHMMYLNKNKKTDMSKINKETDSSRYKFKYLDDNRKVYHAEYRTFGNHKHIFSGSCEGQQALTIEKNVDMMSEKNEATGRSTTMHMYKTRVILIHGQLVKQRVSYKLTLYGRYMDFIWTLYGLYMDVIWTLYGHYMDKRSN